MSSNCPYCGSKKVSKTFNFNEYACDVCESDYKLTESGIRIFREGSWSSLCLKSLQEMANRVSGAQVTDILSRTLHAAAKQSPNDIDVVIESLTSIAATLHSEWKMGLRQVNDFSVVMEGIQVFEKAALTLKKRENELNLKIRIDEAWGESDEMDPAEFEKTNPNAIDMTTTPPMHGGEVPDNSANFFLDPHEGEDVSEADEVPAPEAAPAPEGDAGGSEIDAILDAPADEAGAEADAAPESEPVAEVGAEGTSQDKINDLIVKASELTAALASLKSEEPAEVPEAPEAEVAPEEPAAEETPAEEPAPEGEVAPEGEPAPEAGAEAPAAGGDSEIDDILNSSYSHMGKHIYADILDEAAKKKKNMNKPTTRDNTGPSSYRRKIDNREADKSDTFQTDMDAEEKEEKIPFTEEPSENMAKDTANTGPGTPGKKKPSNKDFEMKKESRDSFNGYRVGDEIVLEKSSDTWKIAEIDGNIFTLVRGSTATVVDTFKESIRHVDTRLEWQRTNELIKESSKRWSAVEDNYTTTNEACVGGVCGLGGGNRLGGQKVGMGNMILSPMTSIATQGNVPSTKVPKSHIYKFIKDNDLHRCQREVAIPRLSEAFTNPIEEMTQILDDAVLSESEGQAENIDGIYEYKCAPIGEHARKDAFAKGWQQVNESEEKPAPKKVVPLAGVGYYRTKENDIIDRLGRTAAERLLGE